jgi:hypothetical protein
LFELNRIKEDYLIIEKMNELLVKIRLFKVFILLKLVTR